MVDPSTPSATPVLDEWLAEVGEDGVVTAVETVKSDVEDKTVPLLRDAASLRAYWGSRRQRA
jgi:hypothetical protein